MKTQCVEIGCPDPSTTRVVLVDPCSYRPDGDYAGDAYYCDQHKEKLPPLFKARLRMVPSPGSSWKPEDDPPPYPIRAPLHPDKAFIADLRTQHGEFKAALRDRDGNTESIWATGELKEGLCLIHLLNDSVFYPFRWGQPVLVRVRGDSRPVAISRENGDRA
jgi:hypothetical protein